MSDFRLIFDFAALPPQWWFGIIALALTVLALLAWKLRGLLFSRIIALAALALLFITPYISHNLLSPLDPVALIIVDQSPSMQISRRPEQFHAALKNLQAKLRANENLQVERYDIGGDGDSATKNFYPPFRHPKKI